MRENIGRRTVTSINFVAGVAGSGTVWDREFADEAEWHIEDMIQAHLEANSDERPEVWVYELPGLIVTALVSHGTVDTVVSISEDDLLRVHTALRTGREISIRYVKETGEVSRRRVRPQSLFFTKGGNFVLRAEDDRREGDTRNFRWDRITHTTLHRRVRRSAPSKSALVREFTGSAPAPQTATEVLYSTSPGTSAALQANEDVQGLLADAFASGLTHVRVPA